ncbi:DUF402 domain-containing protein [Petrotoga olearia]|uniref:DUF402 domain-containing protein n=2 Tax=Petrotoga olearia TaxID=156203 RepID=A0A2K1P4Q1_9BACT|nr:DUF402 domain-containing protein [Petrotoga olearia]KUK16184.1 MAG: Uncharacterized protein XD53_0381 [Petrotoga mobilis]PNR97752.1 hypothetical protein X929_02700 [Petrotoga olearia DSM 13574]RMA76785.1 hypothetical protein C8D75_0443 [Petrotoga olearia]HBT51517.1 hypothetical protein [Petrotoga sp.]
MVVIKYYNFDLKNKIETIKTHAVDEKIQVDEIKVFENNLYGIKRKWKILSSHNSVDFIKRILYPSDNVMLTYYHDEKGEMSKYLVYIDFGKYNVSSGNIEFQDQELDLLVYNNLKYKILDMDELLNAFDCEKITFSDMQKILITLEQFINNFNYLGIIDSLQLRFGTNAINWLLKNKTSIV